MLFINTSQLSGIGQVIKKYAELVNGTIIDDIPVTDEPIFFFCLPISTTVEKIKKLKQNGNKVIYMTVCETETVHESYGYMFRDIACDIAVPSEFCKNVFSRQFPEYTFYVLRHPVSPFVLKPPRKAKDTYIFYHIGNIIDPRKQCHKIIQAFTELNLPNSSLILKATCAKTVNIKVPNVHVINGIIDDEQMEHIHNGCDCYVNFSCSEGVGMGAVEAAMHNKPVIITEYGGASEYINTPYTISCTLKPIGFDDFLYKSDMVWGCPDYNQLKQFMTECYTKKLRIMNHEYTRYVVNPETIKSQMSVKSIQ